MVTSVSQATEIFDKWKKLKSDKTRLDFLCDNSENLGVQLDNDMSFVNFIRSQQMENDETLDDMESAMTCFDQYFGENDSIVLLFKKLGITAEPV